MQSENTHLDRDRFCFRTLLALIVGVVLLVDIVIVIPFGKVVVVSVVVFTCTYVCILV